ncbi:hypothetical protein EHI8A_066620 [Entamoeba histolytica HM-1:IMSS-B]|uniref:Uncharacterized protein n=5 Tax=Entamoeba histolytica TaxID=5759 RepID=C4MB23_ENTH1|nr:hypothetical protein EHI_176160 [Entamoeba histolytica HM-1:IMSS]EAL46224.2 hypothetical protein EHI_176160 [Entamoeba histolytica HM-1:IMSS]EMD47013.1 Hypothetical protein EHI5A_101660 [Entamoeba histolytica KU27]EMH72603.1 hypothetical protein EHI8A_066620 [Entamoeba histolytica HM-1:IMSS-B]ENY63084.1 hypothetical protein EHI7A_063610 [Entamoeba histolytica HM-1:IMSS-A]|eukprot:XP_651610.2 hypothetical protein EHI_176160 [Entamoeba histolytica HM-1:IMSS]
MAYGKFEEKHWKRKCPLTTAALQAVYVGSKTQNKFQLEFVLKGLYLNANPVTSILYLVLLNQYIETNSNPPKFLSSEGKIKKSLLSENQSINLIYASQQEQKIDKEIKKTQEKNFYCDHKSQKLMKKIGRCCLHLIKPNEKVTIKNDFDCLLKMVLIDSVKFFPHQYQSKEVQSHLYQFKLLNNIIDYVNKHYCCECKKRKEYLKMVIVHFIKRPILFNYFTPSQMNNFMKIFFIECKCKNISSLPPNLPFICPSSIELKVIILSSLLPQNNNMQQAIIDLYSQLNGKEKGLKGYYEVLFPCFPLQNYENCLKLSKSPLGNESCYLLYRSLLNQPTLPNDIRIDTSSQLNYCILRGLYTIRGELTTTSQAPKTSSNVLFGQLIAFEDQLKVPYSKQLHFPIIPDSMNEELTLVYARIILFIIDKSNSHLSNAVRFRNYSFNLKPFKNAIKTIFEEGNSSQELCELVVYLYYKLFYSSEDKLVQKKVLLLMVALTKKFERCLIINKIKSCQEEFITLCLQRLVKSPSFYLIQFIEKLEKARFIIATNPSFPQFVLNAPLPLDVDTISFFTLILPFESKYVSTIISSVIASLPPLLADPIAVNVMSYYKTGEIVKFVENDYIDEKLYLAICKFTNQLYSLSKVIRTSLPIFLANLMPCSSSSAFAFYEIVLNCDDKKGLYDLLEATIIILDKDIIIDEVSGIIKGATMSILRKLKKNDIDIVLSKLTKTQKVILKTLFEEHESLNISKKK